MRLASLCLAALLAIPFPAAAQRGQQLFDFFQQGIQGLHQLEQQRLYQEEMQRQHQHFVGLWHACFASDISACDQALSYPYISAQDRQNIFNQRAQSLTLQQAAAERARREQIEAEMLARQRQLEAGMQARQRQLEVAREQESARERARAALANQDRASPVQAVQATTRKTTLGAVLLEWPPTTLSGSFLSALAVAATCLLIYTAYSRRRTAPPAARSSPPPLPPSPEPARQEPSWAGAENPPARPAFAGPRDTAGALAALELASAYIEEVRHAERPRFDDTQGRKFHLNTLALAAKQLDLAQRLDPDAVLDLESDGVVLRYSVNELKAEALLLEGLTHQVYDIKRAIPALTAATELNPQNAHAFYVLGLTHAANMSRAKAIAAYERAVGLEPKNIAYRKELNRVQNMSSAEIAAYRATRAGEKVFDGAVHTANTFIGMWNIFAITWNIVTFPLRLLFRIFRALRLMP